MILDILTIVSLVLGSFHTFLLIYSHIRHKKKKDKGKTNKQKIGDIVNMNKKITKLFEEQADISQYLSKKVTKLYEIIYELSKEIDDLKDETMEIK